MYYRIKVPACRSGLPGQKIVLRMGAIIMLLCMLVSIAPVARAEDLSGAAGSGATPRPAGAEEVLTISGKGDDSVTLSPTSAGELQGLRIYGKTIQDGVPSLENPVDLVSPGDDGSITITISDGGTESQTIEIPLDDPLRGIPVDSGGNYVDENGQEWLCDVIDIDNKKVYRNVGYGFLDGSSVSGFVNETVWHISSSNMSTLFGQFFVCNDTDQPLCNRFIIQNSLYRTSPTCLYIARPGTPVMSINLSLFNSPTDSGFKSFFQIYPTEFVCRSVDFAVSNVSVNQELLSFSGNTIIQVDGCGIEVVSLTPGPDELLGSSISDNFSQSVDDITGTLNDLTANERLPNIAGGDFIGFLRHVLSIFITPDIVTFLVLWVIAAIIIGVYRQLKE